MSEIGRRTAAEAAREIADVLASAGHHYAIGGALALGVAGVPRGTIGGGGRPWDSILDSRMTACDR